LELGKKKRALVVKMMMVYAARMEGNKKEESG